MTYPHIVRLEKGDKCLLMASFNGRTLSNVLSGEMVTSSLDSNIQLHSLLDLAGALAFIHNQNVNSRDIKPTTIIFD